MIPDQCDFCGQYLEEDDEELQPVYVGETPQPEQEQVRAEAPKLERAVGYKSRSDASLPQDGVQVLGRRADEIAALINALEESRAIHVDYNRAVWRGGGLNRSQEDVLSEVSSFDENLDDEVVSVEIETDVQLCDRQPDLEVCEFCVDNFRGGDDE